MRKAGILLPLSSIPNEFGIGDFGKSSYEFIDYLAEAGIGIWQILPLNPLGYGNSPYQPFSSYAGDEIYISLEKLSEYGLLKPSERYEVVRTDHILYEEVRKRKNTYLRLAFSRFEESAEYRAFTENSWVRHYAEYLTCKKKNGMKCWTEWRGDVVSEPGDKDIRYEMFLQFIFLKQWRELKAYANEKGIRIMGDIPFYVGLDSLDVWENRELFKLDEKGYPTVVAGVPPDYFSSLGQRWGNPVYNWEKIREDYYRFWLDRIHYNSRMFDMIRLDHFRAFDTYWEIPASCDTAVVGRWVEGPSYDFFDQLLETYPDTNIIVEDLGDLRSEVYALRDHFGFKGMKILQFSYDPKENNNNFPDREELVVYTGTHDNMPVKGWFDTQPEDVQQQVLENLEKQGITEGDIAWRFVVLAFSSVAAIAIVPMQDILGLGEDSRLNVPGELGSPNWEWKLKDFRAFREKTGKLRELVKATGRQKEKE